MSTAMRASRSADGHEARASSSSASGARDAASNDGPANSGKRRSGRMDPLLRMSSRADSAASTTSAGAAGGKLPSRKSAQRLAALARAGSSGHVAALGGEAPAGIGAKGRSKSHTQLAHAAALAALAHAHGNGQGNGSGHGRGASSSSAASSAAAAGASTGKARRQSSSAALNHLGGLAPLSRGRSARSHPHSQSRTKLARAASSGSGSGRGAPRDAAEGEDDGWASAADETDGTDADEHAEGGSAGERSRSRSHSRSREGAAAAAAAEASSGQVRPHNSESHAGASAKQGGGSSGSDEDESGDEDALVVGIKKKAPVPVPAPSAPATASAVTAPVADPAPPAASSPSAATSPSATGQLQAQTGAPSSQDTDRAAAHEMPTPRARPQESAASGDADVPPHELGAGAGAAAGETASAAIAPAMARTTSEQSHAGSERTLTDDEHASPSEAAAAGAPVSAAPQQHLAPPGNQQPGAQTSLHFPSSASRPSQGRVLSSPDTPSAADGSAAAGAAASGDASHGRRSSYGGEQLAVIAAAGAKAGASGARGAAGSLRVGERRRHDSLGVRARVPSLLAAPLPSRDGGAGTGGVGSTPSVAAPKLDRHNALAGTLGSLFEDRPSGSGGRALRRSVTEAASDMSRRSSTASLQQLLHQAQAHASGSSSRDPELSSSISASFSERTRTASTQSLTAADAAKLAAQLRRARDHLLGATGGDDDTPYRRGGAAGTTAASRAKSSLGKLPEYRADKPVISTFAKVRSDDVDAQHESFVRPVEPDSVYAEGWTQARKVGAGQQTSPQSSPSSKGAAKGKQKIRYVLPYGLSGPPIERNALNEALLAPAFEENEFESSWAPALANAAGLGTRSSSGGAPQMQSEVAADGVPVGDIFDLDGNAMVHGPNALPLHIIHGLTTLSDAPFPLEATDLAASGLPADIAAGQTMLIKPSVMRAIALTVQARAVQRQHTVTRRFADPMHEAIERVARASGRFPGMHKGTPGRTPPASASSTGTSSRWARSPASQPGTPRGRSAPSSPAIRDYGFGRAGQPSRDQQQQQQHAHGQQQQQSYAAQLVDAAEHPVRSLKRVWSGGLARGGLAALTSTAEEPS